MKPHLPFVAPRKYYDLYRRNELKLASNSHAPKDCPKISEIDLGELCNYQTDPDENVNAIDRPENKALVAGLSAQLKSGWQSARPKL